MCSRISFRILKLCISSVDNSPWLPLSSTWLGELPDDCPTRSLGLSPRASDRWLSTSTSMLESCLDRGGADKGCEADGLAECLGKVVPCELLGVMEERSTAEDDRGEVSVPSSAKA